MDQFSIPSNELRQKKKEYLEKMEEDTEKEKNDREISAISRTS